MNFKFYEILTKQKGQIIRLRFWTIAPLFRKYQNLYDEIFTKVSFSEGSKQVFKWKDLDKLEAGTRLENYINKPAEKKEASPCLNKGKHFFYEIKGKNNSVYLMGSLHYGKPDFYPFRKEIESAFDKSENLAVEIDPTKKGFPQKVTKLIEETKLKDGKKLSDILSPEVYLSLKKTLAGFGLPVEQFDSMPIWIVGVALAEIKMTSMGYVNIYGVDNYFLKKAKNNKNILELETFDDQINIMKKMNSEIYLADTLFSINHEDYGSKAPIDAWVCGDEKKMESIIFGNDHFLFQPEFKELQQELFFKRNKKMVNKIKNYLEKSDNYFVVVGSGHLMGKNGIVSLLEKQGYKITRK
ncbi:MAG: TraB/GumN family protein [Desulfobacteraceae bacterium]|nr:TraB/GumN family protein [Desulfobacteraceae bacterium]